MDSVAVIPSYDGMDLIGRTAEVSILDAFLDRASDDGAAQLLTGGPGVGKTVLLDVACRLTTATTGARVVRTSGVEFEAEVGFAGLNQLLLCLQDQLPGLPDLHRKALAVALGTDSGPAGGPLVVSVATLELLRHVARQGPVLVVVDDAQWLDRASARVLGFVARRLAGNRVGILGAVRSDTDSVLLHVGLPEHEVRPLDEPAAVTLLTDRHPGLAAPVRRRVLAAAQGNPLALLELPASMTEGQRRAVDPLPPVLPLSDRLQELFADRVRRLPAGTRRLLLLAALDGTGDLDALRAGSSGDGWLDSLAPAERSQLIRVDSTGTRVVLRHPLIGAAAVELATSGERRRAHTVLAQLRANDPERRAWHLAEAVVGPDEPTAALLEVAAHRALHEGDAVRAVHALLRAADLSPHGTGRARRLAGAAYVGADAAGRLRSMPRLLVEARRAAPDTAEPLEVTVATAYHLLNGEGDVDTAHLMLVRVIQNALDEGHDPNAVDQALHTLMVVCHFGGRTDPWHAFESALSRLGTAASPVLSVSLSSYGAPARATSRTLEELEALIATLSSEVDPVRIVRIALAAFYVDRLPACRPALWRVVRDGRDGGAAASAVNALMMLCHDAYLEGRWDEAARTAQEGIAWSERLGYELVALPGTYALAMLAAARGDEAATRFLTEQLRTWAAPRGLAMVEHFASRARGLAALGRGDFEEAFSLLSSIGAIGRFPPHVPVALWVALDLVEAAIRTGRRAEAEAHVAAMRHAEIFRRRPRLALLAAGSAALVASGADADRRYRDALSLRGIEEYPFERARVQLAYGEHLRRNRAASAARVQLTEALTAFQGLGAQPWVTRGEHELRATGIPSRSPDTRAASMALTPQQYEIASLAASGLTNKEIGLRLYLSPRTVSGHLYRIFPKLGISTRAALRDALLGVRPPTTSHGDSPRA
jgi:DNA-binding CsgD family transcriptional regulator